MVCDVWGPVVGTGPSSLHPLMWVIHGIEATVEGMHEALGEVIYVGIKGVLGDRVAIWVRYGDCDSMMSLYVCVCVCV